MLYSLVYYLAGFFGFIWVYEYYKRDLKQQAAREALLRSLEGSRLDAALSASRKSYEQFKLELCSLFHFERIQIIFGIDFSASNEWKGRRTFNNQILHKTKDNKIFNPYQQVIQMLGTAFEEMFPSKINYSCFGFGDEHTKDFSVFPIVATGEQFDSYQRILEAYLQQTRNVTLGGPTALAPMIAELISSAVRYTKDFVMLIIITDEPLASQNDPTLVSNIRTLANLPNACTIVIGVGDGPWETMSYEEHRLRELSLAKTVEKKSKNQGKKKRIVGEEINQVSEPYDNFHFVEFNRVMQQPKGTRQDTDLARAALIKLPTQLKHAKRIDQRVVKF